MMNCENSPSSELCQKIDNSWEIADQSGLTAQRGRQCYVQETCGITAIGFLSSPRLEYNTFIFVLNKLQHIKS